eukprot:TRINITY_DN23818_c0_g1_i1.p1 TRINITY_DN23818_c0_g1~~TRINITY_DN23818_c0_g1_i1.p1  ORF type:complete len:336 (-),score=94.76 TRINITY_DN23818_c0_g1_i1:296-1303(-)
MREARLRRQCRQSLALAVFAAPVALLLNKGLPAAFVQGGAARNAGGAPAAARQRLQGSALHLEDVQEPELPQPAAEQEGFGMRRAVCLATFGAVCAGLGRQQAARAADDNLIKGEAMPEGYSTDMWKYNNNNKAKNCVGIDECKEIGENSEIEKTKKRDFKVTKSRVRYKDYNEGEPSKGVAEPGKTVSVRYRILRQGKRSNNGLDGNAATVFSQGFGEDDGPKDALLTAPLGQGKWVKALEDAIPGMSVGGLRRVQVRADDKYAKGFGWMKGEGGPSCAQEVKGVVGPIGGGIENKEACLNDLLPQPADWAGKRRFARRFDETLIAEIELVNVE